MKWDATNLVVHPFTDTDRDVIVSVDPERAGWDFIHFQARRLAAGQNWSFAPGPYEIALVVLGGSLGVTSNRGAWSSIGARASVFDGLPEALYLPRDSELTVWAETDCEFGVAWVPAAREHPARLVRQSDVSIEIRGGDNVTRQINGIIRPGFDCDRLVVVEVYTPGGNWSSYPPHKHDVHQRDAAGRLVEADLEEVYYYRLDRPEGYAFQRIYTDPASPLARAGAPIDAVVMLRDNDLALIPEGYHPVTSAPGYTTYYLNVLAGSAQALTAVDDPAYSWVKESYRGRDPRVPVYPVPSGQIV
jgi:5-deoxy-glucuronate isomerase